MKAFDYAVARNPAGLAAALKAGYTLQAGGIDLIDLLKTGVEPSDRIVSMAALDEYRQIEVTKDDLRIGALVTLQTLAEDESVRTHAPLVAAVAGSTASAQVRARATLGGNCLQRPRCGYFRSAAFMCLKKGGHQCFAWEGENALHSIFGGGPCRITHPSSLAPVLVALQATFQADNGSEATAYAADDFFRNTDQNLSQEHNLASDQWLTSVHIPLTAQQAGHVEIKPRAHYDWPEASCAAVRTAAGWRIVLGHVAPLPWRARQAEAWLGDRTLQDPAEAREAAALAVADAEPMRDNGYRVRLAQAAVRRALLQAGGHPAEGLT